MFIWDKRELVVFNLKYTLPCLQHDPSVGELQDFFHAHSTPLVGHYTYATKEKRYKDRRPLVLAFYTVDFGHDHKDGTFSVAN